MSHFVTLVNFYMPKLEENCEENMRYAEQIAEVKEKLTQDPESFALRFLLKRLQSKASTLERSAECEIDELMAPFCEGTDDPAYLEFEDRTDDLRRDYETDKINCVRFPDGTVVPEYSRLVCEKYLIKDGKVFQKKAGHLGHEKRTKKAKKMRAFMGYPVKKLYPSLRQYAEDYCGYRLCEMVGIGFKTADRIAVSMGFDPLSPERVDEGLIFTLTDAELKGHLCMEKHSFLKQCLKLLDTEGLTEEMLAVRASRMLESGRLASYDRQVYRAVTARTEQSLAWAVYRMLTYEKAGSHVNIDTEISAEEKKQGIQLASEQRHAVTTALTSQLSVITGGPGTGKTLIQRFLLDIYRRKNRGAKIICCAPTGRAARRMEQSTGFPATTIHKALGLLAGEDGDYCEPEMLDADLIVVDEVSMMDIYLANHLFRSVPHGSQLVLIGDADQLPSVGPGAVLSEIIACGAVPVVRLDRIFRQSYGSRIAANAKLIRHGNLSLEYGEDFQFYDSCDMSASAQQIETLYLQETARYGVDNVALLTPYRQKTETGVNALNERLREKLNPQDGKKPEVAYRKRIYRLGDKVMQIKNCEDISNGDIGYITSVTRDDTDSVLTVDFGDGRIAEYDGSDLEMLDLAYASTIHKSQGSEYKSVIINLQCAHAVMLVRPLVYTAITRAKERVLIVGERRALCIAIKRTDTEQRGTMLSARIKELISNVKGDHYNGNLAQ